MSNAVNTTGGPRVRPLADYRPDAVRALHRPAPNRDRLYLVADPLRPPEVTTKVWCLGGWHRVTLRPDGRLVLHDHRLGGTAEDALRVADFLDRRGCRCVRILDAWRTGDLTRLPPRLIEPRRRLRLRRAIRLLNRGGGVRLPEWLRLPGVLRPEADGTVDLTGNFGPGWRLSAVAWSYVLGRYLAGMVVLSGQGLYTLDLRRGGWPESPGPLPAGVNPL